MSSRRAADSCNIVFPDCGLQSPTLSREDPGQSSPVQCAWSGAAPGDAEMVGMSGTDGHSCVAWHCHWRAGAFSTCVLMICVVLSCPCHGHLHWGLKWTCVLHLLCMHLHVVTVCYVEVFLILKITKVSEMLKSTFFFFST